MWWMAHTKKQKLCEHVKKFGTSQAFESLFKFCRVLVVASNCVAELIWSEPCRCIRSSHDIPAEFLVEGSEAPLGCSDFFTNGLCNANDLLHQEINHHINFGCVQHGVPLTLHAHQVQQCHDARVDSAGLFPRLRLHKLWTLILRKIKIAQNLQWAKLPFHLNPKSATSGCVQRQQLLLLSLTDDGLAPCWWLRFKLGCEGLHSSYQLANLGWKLNWQASTWAVWYSLKLGFWKLWNELRWQTKMRHRNRSSPIGFMNLWLCWHRLSSNLT